MLPITLAAGVIDDHKVAQYEVVTEDDRDVGDVITYVSELIQNDDPSDDELAKDVAEQVNNHHTVVAGVVPDSDRLYKLEQETLPEKYALHQNYPNPFNPVTSIGFDLPENATVTLTVYDILGREVVGLVDNELQAGRHRASFDASASRADCTCTGSRPAISSRRSRWSC